MNGREWTDVDIETLKTYLPTDLTYEDIGKILNRTRIAVQKKVIKLCLCGDRAQRPKTEKCKEKLRAAAKNRTPWNKGLKGVTTAWNKGKKYPAAAMENNPKWNGGIKKRDDGYIYVLSKNHPRATKNGYVMEHILIAEKMLGRYLVKGETVHHINGKRSDNRPENLYVFKSSSEHMKYHNQLRRFKKRGEIQKYEQFKSLRPNWQDNKIS